MPRVNVKDQRKQHLIEANLQCIARLGLEHTTIADVAKAAEMSRGIVNFYFTSKEQMMVDTLKTLIRDYDAQIDKALKENSGPVEALIAAHTTGKLSMARWLTCWHGFMGQAVVQKEYRKLLEAFEQQLEKKITLPAHRLPALLACLRGFWLASQLSATALSKQEIQQFIRESFAEKKAIEAPAKPVLTIKKKPAPKAPQLAFGDLFAVAE